MSADSDRLQDAPDAITYLSYVKARLEADKATLDAFLAEVGTWVEEQSRGNFASDASLQRIAAILRFHPKLLHGYNALLEPHGRLECSTMVEEVKFFVVINSASARIVPTSGLEVPFPSSDHDLRKIVISKADWKDLLNNEPDKDWLTCISQLLQVILDDPSTDAECNRRTYRCLRELARESVLPPSIFINSLKRGESHAVQGGAFADIYKGDMQGTSVCFRVLRMFETPPEDRELLYKDFCSEVLVWRQLKHINILPFIGANIELFSPKFCFISPWLRNGDIMSYLKQHPDHNRFTSICEIVEGIEYLHGLDPPVTHKDIKGANVLVRDDLVCCLADFGLSTIVESQRLGRGSPAFEGSICWAAPEIMDPTLSVVKNAKAGDIYALACTIYEIYTGRPPFLDSRRAAATIMLAVLRGERPSLPPPGNWTSEEDQLWWLVDLCWKDRPEDRPEMRLIKHTLRDIGMPDKESLLARVPSLAAEAAASAADFREIKEWLEKEYHHAKLVSSEPDEVGSVSEGFPPTSLSKPSEPLPNRLGTANDESGIDDGNGTWPFDQTFRQKHYPGSVPTKSRVHPLQPLAVPPVASSVHASLGLLTPNTPSVQLEYIPIEPPDESDSNFSSVGPMAMTSIRRRSTATQNPEAHPISYVQRSEQTLTMVSEKYSLPTPPSTPLPHPQDRLSRAITKVPSDSPMESTSLIMQTNTNPPNFIPTPEAHSHSQPLYTRGSTSIPSYLRVRQVAHGPRPRTGKLTPGDHGPSPFSHTRSPLANQ